MPASKYDTVEQRARRVKRMQHELALVQHKWSFAADPVAALHWVPSLTATWHGVQRLAGCAIGWYVRDVQLAWQIVGFIKKLPDGNERLKAAAEEALTQWQREIDELTPAEEVSA